MIYSLDSDDIPCYNYDFIIIGGGTVGLIFAKRLKELMPNSMILVIESGSKNNEVDDANNLNHIINRGMPYTGAIEGRRRAIGGTSTVWGGAMLAFQSADMINASWPVDLKELITYESKVDDLFGLDDGQSDCRIGSTDFVQRLCKWPSFRKRNVRNLLDNYLKKGNCYDLLCDGTVVGVKSIDQKYIISVKSLKGTEIILNCRKLIISAGAIETTRLTFLIDEQNNSIITSKTNVLGKFFSDHISVAVAEIIPNNISSFNKKYLFKFGKKGAMTNIRYELTEDTPLRKVIAPLFIHVGYSAEGETTFGYLREIYQAIQKSVRPNFNSIIRVIYGLPWLIMAIYFRFIYKIVLWPKGSRIILNIVVEQKNDFRNQINISNDLYDKIGQRKVEIDWQIFKSDKRNLITSAKEACDFFEMHERNILYIKRFSVKEILRDLNNTSGIYHPTGSTIMGDDSLTSIVDCNLALHADKNIFLLSTSVFPTGGGSNPTKMLLLFAYRLASFLSSDDTNGNLEVLP
jgi:choline dehydrogenase-like flavoprotein